MWNKYEWRDLQKISKVAENACSDDVLCVKLKRSVHSNRTFEIGYAFEKDESLVEKLVAVIMTSHKRPANV